MTAKIPADIDIARTAQMKPVQEIGEKLGIPADALHPYGPHIAKIDESFTGTLNGKKNGKLVLVTALTPTAPGEGKTTTTIGLGDALARLGKKTAICLREPSLGPCFGMKGGAAGGGYAQVVPMESINLHFTGDFHAIGAAHNLLSAMLDNHIHWGNALEIDLRRIPWKRVMDMNDRSLRQIVLGLGGRGHSYPRESGFDITVASEAMAIFCLARNLADLTEKLGRIVVGYTRKGKPVTAGDLDAHGAMAVLLRDAFRPNLVQTLENTPALIHGGPFANIAHGCNSLIATQTAMKTAEYTVTEAGFGADLGAEKFLHIKCRKGEIAPAAAAVVVTIRALKMHGGVKSDDMEKENIKALEDGLCNLDRHFENLEKFGVPPVAAVNRFSADTPAEIDAVTAFCKSRNVPVFLCDHWARGGAGAEELAAEIVKICEKRDNPSFTPLYNGDTPLFEKITRVATELYRAGSVIAPPAVMKQLADWEKAGYGDLPVCMAKTQYSFSTDPALKGAPEGHRVTIREVRLEAGAGFVVAICGEMMTMPGLPRSPAAETIRLNAAGEIEGLF